LRMKNHAANKTGFVNVLSALFVCLCEIL